MINDCEMKLGRQFLTFDDLELEYNSSKVVMQLIETHVSSAGNMQISV